LRFLDGYWALSVQRNTVSFTPAYYRYARHTLGAGEGGEEESEAKTQEIPSPTVHCTYFAYITLAFGKIPARYPCRTQDSVKVPLANVDIP
jgi:hypothetical protein